MIDKELFDTVSYIKERERKDQLVDQLDKVADLTVVVENIEQEKTNLLRTLLAGAYEGYVKILADMERDQCRLSDEINGMKDQIRDTVISMRETVKGNKLSAVFNKGRVSWDNKALDGFSKAHPEILEFKKESEPSVSFRKV